MNNKLLSHVISFYTFFNSLELAGNSQLSMNDEARMNMELMLFKADMMGCNILNEEYSLLQEFYKVCEEFLYNKLTMKGIFTKYFVYSNYAVKDCVGKLETIYNKLMKYM